MQENERSIVRSVKRGKAGTYRWFRLWVAPSCRDSFIYPTWIVKKVVARKWGYWRIGGDPEWDPRKEVAEIARMSEPPEDQIEMEIFFYLPSPWLTAMRLDKYIDEIMAQMGKSVAWKGA